MDDNKWKKLQELGYKVNKSCRLCKHSEFTSNNNFGSCMLHSYEHLKHSDTKRHLSIYCSGVCSDFEEGPEYNLIHAYKDLVV